MVGGWGWGVTVSDEFVLVSGLIFNPVNQRTKKVENLRAVSLVPIISRF